MKTQLGHIQARLLCWTQEPGQAFHISTYSAWMDTCPSEKQAEKREWLSQERDPD